VQIYFHFIKHLLTILEEDVKELEYLCRRINCGNGEKLFSKISNKYLSSWEGHDKKSELI
jgi:hypothetical protein